VVVDAIGEEFNIIDFEMSDLFWGLVKLKAFKRSDLL